jgi:hypothetical protein
MVVFSIEGAAGRLGPGCNGIDSGLLDVGEACGVTFETLFAGKGTSSESAPLA